MLCSLTKLLAAERTMDTLVWQMLASVIIPGYTIHTIVAAVHAGLLPLEATQGLLDFFAGAAPAIGTTPEVRCTGARAGSPCWVDSSRLGGVAAVPMALPMHGNTWSLSKHR
jgi:hypothetical protein